MASNLEFSIWVICFVLGLLFLVISIYHFIARTNYKDMTQDAYSCFFAFVACFVLTIPDMLFVKFVNVEFLPLRIVQSILSSVMTSITSNIGVSASPITIEGYNSFSSLYTSLRLLTNIGFLMSLGNFVCKVLHTPLQFFKLSLSKNKKAYVFSSCNDETISIARSIRRNNKENDYTLIFLCDNLNQSHEDVNRLKAICVEEYLFNIIKKYGKTFKEIEVFMFDKIPENNIIKLEETCSKIKDMEFNNITIYVKLSLSSWSVYGNFVENNGLKDKNIIVNFVRAEETFAYNNLLKNSIFSNTIDDEKYKNINVLIVGGMCERNKEMFKVLLHLGQMPGYFLNITVIDDQNGFDKLKYEMPELNKNGKGEGDSLYHIDYYESIKYFSLDFDKLLEENSKKFTFAFINLEDDFKNIDVALKLKSETIRNKRNLDNLTIQVNIKNEEIYKKWDEKVCNGLMSVGSIKETCNYKFITNSDIERASIAIHEIRYPKESSKKDKEWKIYSNNEYNRRSVFARTLSYKHKIDILKDNYYLAGRPEALKWENKDELNDIWNSMSIEEKKWKEYEHMRWNMYMRTIGYRYDSTGIVDDANKLKSENEKKDTKNDIAKVHKDLVPFNNLPLEEKIKDNLQITDEIVNILKNC